MTDSPQITAAKAQVEQCRIQLMATAHELQERLSPKNLARNTWHGAKEKGADLAENTVDAVRARPLAATGVVAALTLFLAREPLIELATRFAGSGKRSTAQKGRKVKTDTMETAR